MSITICGHCGQVRCVCLAKDSPGPKSTESHAGDADRYRRAGWDKLRVMIDAGMIRFDNRERERS